MYTVTVTRTLVARHFLTVPDPGPEGDLHSHVFDVEVRLSGPSLNEHGYLVDIDAVKRALDDVEARYGDVTLNDLPEFEGENPSVERFARHVSELVCDACPLDGVETLAVRIWEDDEAWAAHRAAV